jgi:hypothetical protein
MHSFPIILGVMLVFSTATPNALAEDATEFGSLSLYRDIPLKGPSYCFVSFVTTGATSFH